MTMTSGRPTGCSVAKILPQFTDGVGNGVDCGHHTDDIISSSTTSTNGMEIQLNDSPTIQVNDLLVSINRISEGGQCGINVREAESRLL